MSSKKIEPIPTKPAYVPSAKERNSADKALSRMAANTAPSLKITGSRLTIPIRSSPNC